ncbi:MAG: ricin-type beta-trefoil lectin domain protein [Streptosporangiaceae bacterium]|nr:ricin-type beta-trefoil lectin domain protein [Streptosporangiaceae bacterium]MBV9855101.1 ricin-type beta-trefoil lectin domain protein [Streptosporangiaceae bacterium]
MTLRSRLRRARKALLLAGAALALTAGALASAASTATPASAASLPCDIYASGGTPCVAAHSTTRALYGSYNGPLYQVRRSSDGATASISPLSAGGVANAAAQDSFCAGTTCVITEIYDQSGHGNNLTQAPGGGAAGGPDNLADATAAPVTVGGHQAYGVYVAPGTGYRDDATSGIATGDQPEGEYAIFDGTHYNGGCCFDYGNAETNNNDNGNGHMEAIYFGTIKVWGYGTGSGPWIMADMENGLYSGVNAGYNANDPTTSYRFTTAMIEGEPGQWAILGGNAQSGGLSTDYSGPRPNVAGYNPMHKEGAIILGIGGDNSNGSAGTFYEGVMTSGYPSAATENAVQASIVAAGYAPSSGGGGGGGGGGGTTGPIVSGVNGSDCVDLANASATNGNKVQLYTCDNVPAAQSWTLASDGSVQIDGGCMDITGANYSNGTPIQWYSCWGGANQKWQSVNGQLVNPASGKCLDDPGFNTANGTQLILWSCNGGANQRWRVP